MALPGVRADHPRASRGLGARRVQLVPRHRAGAGARHEPRLAGSRPDGGGSAIGVSPRAHGCCRGWSNREVVPDDGKSVRLVGPGLGVTDAMTARQAGALLREQADARRVAGLQRFFKTGAGQYAEGDVFIGVTVPQLRAICRECTGLSIRESIALLRSPIHEERLLALLILVGAFRRGAPAERREIYQQYLAN